MLDVIIVELFIITVDIWNRMQIGLPDVQDMTHVILYAPTCCKHLRRLQTRPGVLPVGIRIGSIDRHIFEPLLRILLRDVKLVPGLGVSVILQQLRIGLFLHLLVKTILILCSIEILF